MTARLPLLPALLVLAAASTGGGCSSGKSAGAADAGEARVEDPCGSDTEALAASLCAVEVDGAERAGTLGHAGDEDWYAVVLPASPPGRSLLRVHARRTSPGPTALGVRVLSGADGALLARGAGAGSVELLVRPAGPHLLVVLADAEAAAGAAPGARLPAGYALTAAWVEEPDAHEPNDAAPTALTLARGPEGVARTVVRGVLASPGDEDRFTFPARAGEVLQVRLSAPASAGASPLGMWVEGPEGAEEDAQGQEAGEGETAEGKAAEGPVALTTAPVRLSEAGVYTVRLSRLGIPGEQAADPRQGYTLEVGLYDEADASEGPRGNDGPRTATPASLDAPGGAPLALTGRLGAAADEDWFAVTLAPEEALSALRYRLVPLATGGRFPAPAGPPARRVLAFTEVQAAGGAGAPQRCLTDADACPAAVDGGGPAQVLREESCRR